MDEFFSGNIREKLNDPAFQKKVVEHNDKGMEFIRNNYNKNKKRGEKDQENFKVYQFKVTPSRFIVDLFLIYLICNNPHCLSILDHDDGSLLSAKNIPNKKGFANKSSLG